jgi:hypothetical protein
MPEQKERIVREFATEEERQQWRQAVAEAEAPELIERHRIRKAEAAGEPTLSGQLRRAVIASGIDHPALAEQTGLTMNEIGAFMCGHAALDSDTFGRLSSALNLQLMPISQ